MKTVTRNVTAASPLRQKRVAFTRLKCRLYVWMECRGFEVAADEGRIITPRKVRLLNGSRVMAHDAVHAARGNHPKGLAEDMVLYNDEDGDKKLDYVTTGDHPIYFLIAEKWESMHPLCVSGVRWKDANHISFDEGSKDVPLEKFFSDFVVRAARAM